jgi:hypothetical protein
MVPSFATELSSAAGVPQATTTDPTSSTRTAVRTVEQLLQTARPRLELLL